LISIPRLKLTLPPLKCIVGAAREADIRDLFAFARTVGTFTLTDKPADSMSRISSGSYIRLAQLQIPGTPFFPSLNRLRIDHGNGSVDQLNLLVTNSLRFLEVVNIDKSQHSAFLLFLYALADECPHLISITFSSRFSSRFRIAGWLGPCFQFRHLRELKLDGGLHQFHFEMLVLIGEALPELDSFILDAEYYPPISTPQPKNAWEVSNVSVPLGSQDGIQEPAASTMGLSSGNQEEAKMASGLCPSDDRTPQDGATSPPMSPTKNTSLLPKPTFRQLRKLHIVGCLELIHDLLSLCSGLEDVSMTLVRSDELTQSNITRKTDIFTSVVEGILSMTDDTHLTRLFIGQQCELEAPSESDPLLPLTLPPILPSHTVKKMLLHPTLEYLEIANWTLDATAACLDCLAPSPLRFKSKLTTLHLPVGNINPGINLSELRYLAVSCPDLVSLRSTIILDIKNLPEYKVGRAADVPLSHNLQTMSVGSVDGPTWNSMQYLTAARHLFVLFPALRIHHQIHPGWNPVRWIGIRDALQMYQTVCLDDNARSSPHVL
jgi:hypothetical protein